MSKGPLVLAIQRIDDAVVNLRAGNNLGAGVVVDPSGIVLTNHHVIAEVLRTQGRELFDRPGSDGKGTPQIVASFGNGRQLPAVVLIANLDEDIAVLRLRPADSAERFPAAKLGNSSALAVGEEVFAVGNPFGLTHSVSVGFVSALDRTDVLGNRQLPLVQLNAIVNDGNSGGPLFNLESELVGITTAKVKRSQAIGFAIPIDHVRAFLRSVEQGGSRRTGVIGAVVQALEKASPGMTSLGFTTGILVEDVREGQPAHRAGMRKGDEIVELRARRFDGLVGRDGPGSLAEHFVQTVRALFPGEQLPITVVRGKQAVNLTVEVAAADARRQVLIDADQLLGLALDESQELPIVASVRPSSEIARYRGNERLLGARITQVLGRDVKRLEDLGSVLGDVRAVVRQGKNARISMVFRAKDRNELRVSNYPVSR